HGQFYWRHTGYLVAQAEPYMHFLPEKFIGLMLILFGLIKLVGVFKKDNRIKNVASWGLSTIWGGLFFTALLYSFGTGNPSVIWIDRLLVLAMCLHVSLRG